MSYILDALKRADAERERGAVPGLHSRQATGPAFQAARSLQQRAWMAAALLALAGLAAASLWIWQRPVAAVRLAAVETAAPQPPVPLAQPVPVLPPMPMPATPAAAAAAPSAPPPAPAASRPVPSARPAPTPAPAPPPPRPKADPVAKQASSQAAPPAVRPFSDLSEDLRRQIPPLAITDSVYSSSPGKRLLLVNNQVLAQGSLAAPEVTLEEIQAKSSVFSFRGTRFRVAH